MTKIISRVIVALSIFIIVFAISADTADAQSRRSRTSTSTRTSTTALSRQPIVENMRIPILFGVSVGNLYDSWGDARSGGREHEGIDILAPRGAFIVSPTEAVVTEVDTGGNGGRNVSTTNPGGERYYYAHLDEFAEGISRGDKLAPGDLIGYVGNTGNAAGGPTHLHFGIYGRSRGALNPFPRLTEEFTAKEKVAAFTKILNATDKNDRAELVNTVVSQNKDVFVQALAEGVKLSDEILTVLTEKRAEVIGIGRNLQQGMTGEDVKALQAALGVTADGEFGPRTRVALIAFQQRSGILADGVAGASTLVALSNSSLVATALPVGCTAGATFSTTTGARCVPTIVIPLPAGCTATTAFSTTTGSKCRP